MSFSFAVKTVASFVNQTKNVLMSFLLKEDGGYLLLEDGGRIILDDSDTYTFNSKNTS